MLGKRPQFGSLWVGLVLAAVVGCHPVASENQATVASVQVSVLQLQPTKLLHSQDLPGRVVAVRSAEIRAQVSGIVQQQVFEQGSELAAGTVLYQINAAPFQAEVESAAAALHKAEAIAARTELESTRLAALSQRGVISRQVYDDALSLRDQAKAEVALATASLKRRQLDLQFARVTAPIAGRIDQSLVSEGALVSPTDATPMARIQQIDQVYVDVRLPATLLAAMQQPGKTQPDSQHPTKTTTSQLPVEILSSEGAPLQMQGRILFSGSAVDSGTGDVLLRLLVDNPAHLLLPGLYVQARVPVAAYPAALLLPQQALSRLNGESMVWLLDEQYQVQPVAVTVGELIDGHYRILSGLSAGQQVVVAGMERLTPALKVTPRPWPGVLAAQHNSHSNIPQE